MYKAKEKKCVVLWVVRMRKRSDREEADTESGMITVYFDHTTSLPIFTEYSSHVGDSYTPSLTALISSLAQRTGISFNTNRIRVLPIKSDPTNEDSDGDGLLDGKAKYVNGKKVVPKDTQPLTANLSASIWNHYVDQKSNRFAATEYKTHQTLGDLNISEAEANYLIHMILPMRDLINANENSLRNFLLQVKKHVADFPENATKVGAYILNFVYDDKNMAYHSQNQTWQRKFGYSDLYDDFFRIGSNMNYMPIKFTAIDGKNYSLWSWKGDYWNLNSGAEVGLYVNDPESDYISTNNTTHYSAVDYEIPMTLCLYDYAISEETGSIVVRDIFSWEPTEPQWWITGFNALPEFANPDANMMVMISTVDFSEHLDLYDALKTYMKTSKNKPFENYFIFDDEDSIVWINWQ